MGRAGIAPFLVVVIAPQAHAYLSTSFNFASSCKSFLFVRYITTKLSELMATVIAKEESDASILSG